MSRPKPTVIFVEQDDSTRYEVCAADAVYAVCCDGQPISIKKGPAFTDYPGPKYIKTSFPNAGHAFNLAERLNKKFNTDQFSVVLMNSGRTIREK